MNTYDPADFVRYVHMSQGRTSRDTTGAGDLSGNRLPIGYANQSPMTRLRMRSPLRASQSSPQFPLAADAVVAFRPSSSPEPAATPG